LLKENQVFTCPVCKNVLNRVENMFKCKGLHTFDVAKEGYINLLLANQKNSKEPGDSKEMIIARNKFLSAEYYKPLSDAISNVIDDLLCQNTATNIRILDAGCGEGYYIDKLNKFLRTPKNIGFYGIDISKEAIKIAAKRNKDILFSVASIFEMPVKSKSIDLLMNIFAPLTEGEFARVLKDNGKLLVVSPGANHLFELKEKLYENPYVNDENKVNLEKFKVVDKIRVKYNLCINTKEDIQRLILMTPYYWNTDMKKIIEISSNESSIITCAEFIITIYSKDDSIRVETL